jgi:hypothetical protein
MNKLFTLITALVCVFQISNAQTEKGTQTLGANAGFTYLTNNSLSINPFDNSGIIQNSKMTIFSVGPNYSYFIADKLDIAAVLSYNSSVTNNANNSTYPYKQTSYTYGGQFYLRKYFIYAGKIGFRTGAFLGYSRQNQQTFNAGSNSIYNLNSKYNNYDAGLNLDMVYYASKKLGFAASIANLSYTHFTENNANQGGGSGDGVNLNFITNGLLLSMFYVLGHK